MKTPLILLGCLGLSLTPLTARAQLVADGATATINATTTNISGNLIIGTNGSFTTLIVMNAGGVTNSGSGILGQNSTARTNRVVVTGTNSAWTVGNTLNVGFSGAGNLLVVSNGGAMRNVYGSLGLAATSSNNVAVVTGSVSVWSNAFELYIGEAGAGNQLIVSNSGSVIARDLLVVGFHPNSAGNRVVVDGGTLRVTNATGNGVFDVQRGTNLLNTGTITANQLLVTNALGFFEFNGGTLVTRGAIISNGAPFVVGRSGTTPAVWDLRAGGSTLLSDYLTVGNGTAFNQVFVTNGATPTSYAMEIGVGGSGRSNAVTISGPGSRWTTGSIEVGFVGSQNSLLISNGAVVTCSFSAVGSGGLATGDENQIILTGAGSALDHSGDIIVGYTGDNNRIIVSHGATMRSASGSIGVNSTSISNLAVVTDPGSVWSNTGTLFLGTQGRGNQIVVSNGGWFTCSNALIGEFFTSSNNLILLSDAGSRWHNAGNLALGVDSPHNLIIASNGAAMWSSNATFGVAASIGIGNNRALLTGAGTVWSNQNSLILGNTGQGNRLTVDNGAKFSNGGNVTLGANSSGSNSFTLTGAGTQFYPGMNSDLTVGSNGMGCALIISNGAVADCRIATLGYAASSSANEFTLSSPGSILRSGLNTIIGRDGPQNRMTIRDGASLLCATGMLGLNSGSFSNEVTVTGPGATWINRFDCYIGNSSAGNRLTVTDGGLLIVSNNLFMGVNPGSTNNLLTVDGGTLQVKNPLGHGLLDLRRGKIVFNTGTMELDSLQILNSAGAFDFNGGTLSVKNSYFNNGTTFFIGNGTNAATLILAGNGTHVFSVPPFVGANATLTGNGSMSSLILAGGSTFKPGASIGKIIVTNSPVLSGDTIMEISRAGLALTNDQLQVLAPITYGGGTLVVTNIGPDEPALGNRFKLFDATSYSGSFAAITFPALAPGLGWTNQLLVDGTIEVIAVLQPAFTSISVIDTNVIISGTNGTAGANYAVLSATNVTTPATNWQSLVTNQFGAGGQFSFTNGINPNEPQRYFRLRTP